MLDFGWAELFVVMAVAVFVIGPKDIPQVMRAIGKMFRRFQYMKHAISQQFDQIMHDVDVTDVNFEASRAPADADFNEADEDEEYMVPIEDEKKEARE